ncbi:MAG: hypothetical protein ACO1OQ_00150 [Rufibacter sp.]
MLQNLRHRIGQLWFEVPGFSRHRFWVRVMCPALRNWRARASHGCHYWRHRVTLSTTLSSLIRPQVTAWSASGTSLSTPRTVLPWLYLLFRRLVT